MKFFKRRKRPGQTIDAVAEIEEHQAQIPVSYTHLTLPTILLV